MQSPASPGGAAAAAAAAVAKDIMHVGAVLGSGTEPRDVELAELSLLWQFNVMAKVTVVSLEEKHRKRKVVVLQAVAYACLQREALSPLCRTEPRPLVSGKAGF